MEESESFSKTPGYCHWVLVIFISLFVYLFIFSVNKFLFTIVKTNFYNLSLLKFFWHAEAVPQRCSTGGGCSADVLQIFWGMYLCMGVISIKLQSGFVEIALLHCYSVVGLLCVCRASFLEKTSGGLLLNKNNFTYNF